MESLLTTKEVAEIFKVKSRTITQKFIPLGLKYIPIGSKDYRFKKEDVKEFMDQLKEAPMQNTGKTTIRYECNAAKIDFEKIRINRTLNRVV